MHYQQTIIHKHINQLKNQFNSTPIWKCPHCFTEIQLINIQTTPDIIIQSNRLYHKKIRTNPWINNSKYNIPITSYSYSSSLTDSGIYLCTDNNKNKNNNNSHYDYITRSTTETDINKNNYFNIKKNDIPIIPISPDPPPSPAPKCTQCIINLECLKHTNENQDLFMNSNKSYKGFSDEKSSSYKNNETININDKHNLLNQQSDIYDDIYNTTYISNSQSIIDNELNQSMITSFIENMSPELFKSMNLNNDLNFSTIYNNHSNSDKDQDNFCDDIQLENLRTNLKILSEAKNVINMQMRNLGQNYINYLKSKYLMNTMKDQ
ncbi:unnamed protein product [Schistosoma mattheei]|uniref:Uncharacterized protein n=1 Tax=Schistosoma mattheei TaxID=31246 RepID=A0AA85BX19_9TREM|nr:unnamed protein product [Schistosoma mattheei]